MHQNVKKKTIAVAIETIEIHQKKARLLSAKSVICFPGLISKKAFFGKGILYASYLYIHTSDYLIHIVASNSFQYLFYRFFYF